MIVDSDSNVTFCLILTDDVLVEILHNLFRCRDFLRQIDDIVVFIIVLECVLRVKFLIVLGSESLVQKMKLFDTVVADVAVLVELALVDCSDFRCLAPADVTAMLTLLVLLTVVFIVIVVRHSGITSVYTYNVLRNVAC